MRWSMFILGLLFFAACQEKEEIVLPYSPELMEIPKGFPEMEFPEDNAFTPERWELGKRLFFDPVMSADSTKSCASCHQPALAFSDDVDFSLGVEDRIGTRNSPSLANIGYHPYFTREGGVPTLEMQVLVPIQEHLEFDFNIVLIADRLKQDPVYVEMAYRAYDQHPNAYVITRAIANFERSLLSGYSRYDQFEFHGRINALTPSEERGMQLFFSEKTSCSTCHSGFNFSNYAFENNGLYEKYADVGRFRFTGDEADKALFKVPGLRNVGLTNPYMHDGSLQSLEEVVEHYNSGGKDHFNKNPLVRSLNLTTGEKEDLVAFLKSLTDETFVNNPIFKK